MARAFGRRLGAVHDHDSDATGGPELNPDSASLNDTGQDPSSDGEFRNNGGAVKVHSGGSVLDVGGGAIDQGDDELGTFGADDDFAVEYVSSSNTLVVRDETNSTDLLEFEKNGPVRAIQDVEISNSGPALTFKTSGKTVWDVFNFNGNDFTVRDASAAQDRLEFKHNGNGTIWTDGGGSSLHRIRDAANTRNFIECNEGETPLFFAPNSTTADSVLANSQWTAYLDETNDNLEFKAQYSGGTVKTGTVSLT